MEIGSGLVGRIQHVGSHSSLDNKRPRDLSDAQGRTLQFSGSEESLVLTDPGPSLLCAHLLTQ